MCIRGMFINERGGYDGSPQDLFLLQAIPREWLRPGYRIVVRDMGSWFGGRIDLLLEIAPSGNSVAADIRLKDLAVAPREIRVRLRSGDNRPLVSAETNGVSAKVSDGDVIRLPPVATGDFKIQGKFT